MARKNRGMSPYRRMAMINMMRPPSGGVQNDSDADAEAYLLAYNITDETEKSAWRQLVSDLKTINEFYNKAAIWPMLGADPAKVIGNGRDPDTFELTLSNGPLVDANGITFNGVDEYADTGLDCSLLALTNASIGAYSLSSTDQLAAIMGAIEAADDAKRCDIFPRLSDTFYGTMWSVVEQTFGANSDAKGLWVMSRASATSLSTSKDGTVLDAETAASTGARPALNLFLGGRNADNVLEYPWAGTMGFAFAGDAVTDLAGFNAAVQQFMTTLNRI